MPLQDFQAEPPTGSWNWSPGGQRGGQGSREVRDSGDESRAIPEAPRDTVG